jgi:hypothetical protein
MLSGPIFVVDREEAGKLLPVLWEKLGGKLLGCGTLQQGVDWDNPKLDQASTRFPQLVIIELTDDKKLRTVYSRATIAATIRNWPALRLEMKVFVITPVGFGREVFEQPPPVITFLPSQEGEVNNLRYILSSTGREE